MKFFSALPLFISIFFYGHVATLAQDKVVTSPKTHTKIKAIKNSKYSAMFEEVWASSKTGLNPKGKLQPITPVKGVIPVGELEVLEALKDPSFKVVDMRTKAWRVQATIKGSIHIPFTQIDQRLNELGCVGSSEKWDCSKAAKVIAFCNGATCSQSPTAIKIMVKEGYPANRIYYYRGGIQSWILRWLMVAEE